MDFSNLLEHPDKEEIISKLLGGTDPKEVFQWLKVKYPEKKQSHLRLTLKLLQEFTKSQYVDAYKQYKDDINNIKSGSSDKINKKISATLLNNKTYHERLNEIADKELNIRKILVGTIMMIQDRAIQIFDKIQENPEAITKAEYALIKWIEQLLSSVEKYEKLINQAPDQIIQHNFTIQYVDQQAAVFQEVIRELLAEMDPEISMKFMEKLSVKLSRLKPPTPDQPLTLDQRVKEAEIIGELTFKDFSEKEEEQ